ncbi:hypothetical protein CWI38_0018p0100 [Hamiltosporidium tvaerminnensis]|uniref:Uncharacterized protein n=1 Tax=Hamiltosporidium tvaerminnensis TaxID=1176355 RepID=A0A4Q9M4B2_9MICR|nr:hypothetical protein CWI38_0018p0100 [Hamiltosporidium tvaerminnensis]
MSQRNFEVFGFVLNREISATDDTSCEDTATLFERIGVHKCLGIIEDNRSNLPLSSLEDSKEISIGRAAILKVENTNITHLALMKDFLLNNILSIKIEDNLTNYTFNSELSAQDQRYSNNVFVKEESTIELHKEAADNDHDDTCDIKQETIAASFSTNDLLAKNSNNFNKTGSRIKKSYFKKNPHYTYGSHKRNKLYRSYPKNYDTGRSSVSSTRCDSYDCERLEALKINKLEPCCWDRYSEEQDDGFKKRKIPANLSNAEVEDKSTLIRSYSDFMEDINSSPFKKRTRMSKSQPESTKKTLKLKLGPPPTGYFKEMINTKRRSYAVFSDSKEDLCYTDIQTFISGDFYIDANRIHKDPTPFINLIDSVAEKEKNFWDKFEKYDILCHLSGNMVAYIEKVNLCDDDSPLFVYYSGLIHFKHFLRNIIAHNINLVKNSCLWTLLLKYVQFLSIIPIKNEHRNTSVKTCYSQYEDYDMYGGNRNIFHDMYIGFSRVISDCILRIYPDEIIIFLRQIQKQSFFDLNCKEYFRALSSFLRNMCSSSTCNDYKDICEFKIFYKKIILAYIDFLKYDAPQSESFYDEDGALRKSVSDVKIYFESSDIEKIASNCVDLTRMMKFSEALCVIFNHYIKVGLNDQAYSDVCINMSALLCKKRMENIYTNSEIDDEKQHCDN